MNPPIKTKSDEAALQVGCYYDPEPAKKFKLFYEKFCCLTEDCHAGKTGDPVKLISWQEQDIIQPMLGWKNADHSLRFAKGSFWVPKKNNKSGLISSLAIHHLMSQPGAYCQVLASTEEQARKTVWNFAMKTLRYGPLKKFVVTANQKTKRNSFWIKEDKLQIYFTNKEGIRSELKVAACRPEGISGPSASLCIYDEFAEWPGTHARTIYERLIGATMARSGQHIIISTPQFDRSHLGFEQWSYAKSILDGEIIDPSYLPVIYGIPEDATCICGKCDKPEGWRCPEWWWKANPSAGITAPKKFFYNEYTETKNNPLKEAGWRTLHCGQWVGSAVQWLSSDSWARCAEPFKEEDFHGLDAVVGLDMATRHDLAAYVIVVKRDDKFWLIPRCFMPEQDALKKGQKDRVPYERWADQGLITLTQGDIIDQRVIRERLLEDSKNFKFREIRFDATGMELLRQILEYDDGFKMHDVPQNISHMAAPTSYFERCVIDGTLKHNNHAIQNWCVGNVCPKKPDGEGRTMPDKGRSTNRIDIAVAAVMALSGWMEIEVEDDPFVLLL